MEFDIEVWKDYYKRTHELSISRNKIDHDERDFLLTSCSEYLDSCDMKIPFSQNLEDYKKSRIIEKEKKDINKLNNLLEGFHDEKSQLRCQA